MTLNMTVHSTVVVVCIIVVYLATSGESCVTVDNIRSLNESTFYILNNAGSITTQDEELAKNTICSGPFRDALNNIENKVTDCWSLMMSVPHLVQIKILDMTFQQFVDGYDSVEDFCDNPSNSPEESCVTEDNIRSLNESTYNILNSAGSIPTGQEKMALCSSPLRDALDNIEIQLEECGPLIVSVPQVSQIQILGMKFEQFMEQFDSMDHFCGQSCVTADDIRSLNESTFYILDNVGSIPPGQEEKVLKTLCSNSFEYHLNNIERLVRDCFQLIEEVHQVLQIEFLNMSFVEFVETFESVEHFCGCSPYLPVAYELKNQSRSLYINETNAGYPIIADISEYCYNFSYVYENRLHKMLRETQHNEGACYRLAQISGLKSRGDLMMAINFIEDQCPTFDHEEFLCAIEMSKLPAFKTCLRQAASSTGDGSDDPACMRRRCVIDSMDTCGYMAVDTYIFAVNNVMVDIDHADNPLIRQFPCSRASNIRIHDMIVTLVVALFCHFR